MKQYEQVIEAIRQNGGFATLRQLYNMVDYSTWGTKTPNASVRRIVQKRPEIFKIRTGLWALEEIRHQLPEHIAPTESTSSEQIQAFDHYYYQGLLVELGNVLGYKTYVPAQDKNQPYLQTVLGNLATRTDCPNFSHNTFINRARTVDVIWFNEREMPTSMYEVEHTTNMQNSLLKFVDLQDFYIDFFIVADASRKSLFQSKYSLTAFDELRKNQRVRFIDYEQVSKRYNSEQQNLLHQW